MSEEKTAFVTKSYWICMYQEQFLKLGRVRHESLMRLCQQLVLTSHVYNERSHGNDRQTDRQTDQLDRHSTQPSKAEEDVETHHRALTTDRQLRKWVFKLKTRNLFLPKE